MWKRYRTISNLEETWDEQKKKPDHSENML